MAVEEVYSYVSFYTPPYDVLLLAISFALAVLVFAAWVTFCARVKVGRLWKGTIIYKLLRLCWKIVKWCWRVLCAFCRGVVGLLHAIPLVWRTAVGCFVVSMMLGIFAANRAGGGDAANDACAVRRRVPLLAPASESSRRRAKPSPPAILTRRWTQSGCIGTLSATPRT